MRVFVVVAIVGVLLGSCSKGTGGSVTEADAKHALCADLLRGRAASNPQERETMNQRLLADAHLFDQAGDHATAKGIRALVDAIRTLDRLRREKTQMAVFLDNDASQSEIDTVEQSLSNTPGVVSVRFESKEEAYRRLKEVIADYPDLIETFSPDILPESFRVQLTSSATFDPVHDTPERMAAFSSLAAERPSAAPWHFVTTRSQAELQPILAAYGQAVDKKQNPMDPTGPLNHSLRVFLIDRAGNIRNIYSSATLDLRLVLADVRTLMNTK